MRAVLSVDELGSSLERPAEPIGEVARGDLEAGADHGHLVVARELAAVACEELGLGLVPERLGIEQQAVHVEDHGPIAAGERHPLSPRREERAAGVAPARAGAA